MAERTCPVCTKRPVWRTNQSNNWRHLCKRCYPQSLGCGPESPARSTSRDQAAALNDDAGVQGRDGSGIMWCHPRSVCP